MVVSCNYSDVTSCIVEYDCIVVILHANVIVSNC